MSDFELRQYRPGDEDAVWELLVGELRASEPASDLVAMGAIQLSAAVDHRETDRDTAVLRELESRAVEVGFERLVLDTMPAGEMIVYENVLQRRLYRCALVNV